MKKEAVIGALIGVGIALIYAVYETNRVMEGFGAETKRQLSYTSYLFDAWFKPAIILAIIGFAIGYVLSISHSRKE